MDKNLIIILQKYSVEVLVLAFAVLVAVYLTKKILKGKFKNVGFYLPYIYGILAYLGYSAIFSKEYSQSINMGITTGAVSVIYKALFSCTNKHDFIENLLSGFIAEENLKSVCLNAENFAKQKDKQKIVSLLLDNSLAPISEEQAESVALVILEFYSKTP